MSVVNMIETEARFLILYQRFAESFRTATRRYSRDATPENWDTVRRAAETCERCRKRLADLIPLVRVHLPETYAKLRVVPDAADWHMLQRFDWDAAIGELRTIEAAAAIRAVEGPVVTTPTATAPDHDLDDKPISPSKLADRLGIPKDDKKGRWKLEKRLQTWRNNNRSGGWVEDANARGRQARYLYPLRTVWPIVEDLRHSG